MAFDDAVATDGDTFDLDGDGEGSAGEIVFGVSWVEGAGFLSGLIIGEFKFIAFVGAFLDQGASFTFGITSEPASAADGNWSGALSFHCFGIT